MKVLKFGAVWCSGCLVMKPRWIEIEKELDWLETAYYDVDQNINIKKEYGVDDLPCFIFLDENGDEIERLHGEISKKVLLKKINQYKDK